MWYDVDVALTRFATAICPADQRPKMSTGSNLRREISFPTKQGGLGLPQAAKHAPVWAALSWSHSEAI